MSLRIRAGDTRDLESLMPVMAAAFDPQFGESWSLVQCTGMLALPGSHLLVALDGVRPAGFALFRTLFEDSELLLIAVDPKSAQTGIGSSLLERVVTESVISGAQVLHVEVRADNAALAFYEKRGFVPTGVRNNYYRRKDGGPAHAISMARNIALVP